MTVMRVLLSLGVIWVSCVAAASPPNVIIVFADDFGFDIASYGAPTVLTPNLDRMAYEGAKFTSWNSGENICSPSRAALLTGRYAVRSGVYGAQVHPPAHTGDHRVIHPNCYGQLLEEEVLLPHVLKGLGYTTAQLGKWHLGFAYDNVSMLPISRGFDHVLGTPATHCESGGSYPSEALYKDSEVVGHLGYDVDVDDLTQNYTAFGVEFIKSSVAAEKPFFLYAAFDNTHGQVYSSKAFQGKSLRGPYGDATMELDWAVGQFMSTLEALNAVDNTIIFFTSDNGAWNTLGTDQGGIPNVFVGEWAYNPKYRAANGNNSYVDCQKGSTWEGGVRVPAMAWGGPVKQAVHQDLVSTLDLFPTIIDLAGGQLPSRTLDGASFKPLLTTGSQSPPARTTFFYYATHANVPTPTRVAAVRVGEYKVHYYTHSGFGSEPWVTHDPPLVFNVDVDPQERSPVEATPAILSAASAALAAHNATMTFGAPQLDLIDYKAMDCSGLPADMSGCCESPTGRCAVHPKGI